jgi:hypothetical protein
LPNESFTLIVVPDHHAEVKRYRLQRRWLFHALGLLGIIAALLAAMASHYASVVGLARENPGLREENLKLTRELAVIREQLKHVATTLDRVERFDQKLRAITLLSDPQRNLAGSDEPSCQAARSQPIRPIPARSHARPSRTSWEALRRGDEGRASRSPGLFQSRNLCWHRFRPSGRPVGGDFRLRLSTDPCTWGPGVRPVSIAGPRGKSVVSPADGTVVFAGLEGGYKRAVIDHGYGIKARYDIWPPCRPRATS